MPEPGFPHGRPRLDKIGTGEGAAAYGWGWYSAAEKATARGYTKTSNDEFFEEVLKDFSRGEKSFLKEYLGRVVNDQADDTYFKTDFNFDNLEESLKKTLFEYDSMIKENEGFPSAVKNLTKEKATLERFAEKAESIKPSLYQLDIPDEVMPKLLDWDRPLSEQSEYVKKALKKARRSYGEYDKSATGKDLYEDLYGEFDNDKAASEYLKSIGIPGNTHGGVSKGATGAKYVIWDQDVLDRIALLERNGEKLQAMSAGADPTDPSTLKAVAPVAATGLVASQIDKRKSERKP
jgi:hypothetical protein